MRHIIVEIKARCPRPDEVRRVLQEKSARCVGTDRQVDTYFRVNSGRLKLREGRIEHALIYYERPNQHGPKISNVLLYNPEADPALKSILTLAIGVDVVVDKIREIYFVDNVKVHLDQVESLGSFVEIEAIADEPRAEGDGAREPISETASRDRSELVRTLRGQCVALLDAFNISESDLLSASYSDMIRDLY